MSMLGGTTVNTTTWAIFFSTTLVNIERVDRMRWWTSLLLASNVSRSSLDCAFKGFAAAFLDVNRQSTIDGLRLALDTHHTTTIDRLTSGNVLVSSFPTAEFHARPTAEFPVLACSTATEHGIV
jgi:hypothetical protein